MTKNRLRPIRGVYGRIATLVFAAVGWDTIAASSKQRRPHSDREWATIWCSRRAFFQWSKQKNDVHRCGASAYSAPMTLWIADKRCRRASHRPGPSRWPRWPSARWWWVILLLVVVRSKVNRFEIDAYFWNNKIWPPSPWTPYKIRPNLTGQ